MSQSELFTPTKRYGYTIDRVCACPESWNVECGCGWWRYGQTSRRAAELALRAHRLKHAERVRA